MYKTIAFILCTIVMADPPLLEPKIVTLAADKLFVIRLTVEDETDINLGFVVDSQTITFQDAFKFGESKTLDNGKISSEWHLSSTNWTKIAVGAHVVDVYVFDSNMSYSGTMTYYIDRTQGNQRPILSDAGTSGVIE